MSDIKILFVSLGCDKNLVDSEEMIGMLSKNNFSFTYSEDDADVVIINSCCFINDAKEESIDNILHMAELKNEGRLKGIIVTGCLAERYKDEIIKEIPEVDAILGTASYDNIIEAINQILTGNHYVKYGELDKLIVQEKNRVITTGGHYGYLKIAEGCNKNCTYCIIPRIRGRYRSVDMERLIETAIRLANNGVKELILVAQETSLYGVDIYGKKMLPELLKRLSKISGIEWIRLLYCYPEEITDELIQVIKTEDKICNYIDMPIQHSSDAILKAMGRRTNRKELVERINKIRQEIPDVILRTSLITGFPGETEEDVDDLLDFVDEMEFDRLGVFTYSQEEDTKACEMDNQIDEDIKSDRRDRIMELQQEIAFEKAKDKVGKTFRVIIEGKLTDENAYVGRTYMDAPNVDGCIFVNTAMQLMTGDMVNVKVTGASEYDLIGEIQEV